MAKRPKKTKAAPVPRLFPELPVPVKPLKSHKTEVEAYEFIRQQLRELGWIVRSPHSRLGGQVWTQNECFAHPEIRRAFGQVRPENIVKLSESRVWVIEAKANRKDLPIALSEAKDFYCKKINEQKGSLGAVLATGVAGTEDHHYSIIESRII